MYGNLSDNCPSCLARLRRHHKENDIGCLSSPTSGPLCEACTQVQSMENRILAAEEELRTLRRGLAKWKRLQNETHSPIISRLFDFPEVLSEIFISYSSNDSFEGTVERGQINLEKQFFYAQGGSTSPLPLGAVCTHWRDVAWSTPRLWNTINVGLNGMPVTASYVKLAGEWLQRSGQLPLTIMMCPRGDDHRIAPTNKPPLDALCELVNQYSDRWQVLCLKMPGSLFPKFNGSSSMLDTLVLHNIGSEDDTIRFSTANTRPKLRHLSVCSIPISLVDFDPTNLRSIDMVDFKLDDLLQLLLHAPELRRCSLSDAGQAPASSSLIVTHLGLEDLEVSLPRFPTRFLNAVSLPALKRLTWHVSPTLPVNQILVMTRRSSCNLTDLTLERCKMTDTLIPLLEEMPSLQFLSISGGSADLRLQNLNSRTVSRKDQLFELLAETSIRREGDVAGFLPNLQSLRLGMPDDTNWWTYVPAIFGPISDINNPHRRPLRILRIDWVRHDVITVVIQREIPESFAPFLEAGFTIRLGEDAVQEAIKRHNLMGPVNAM